MMSLPGRGKRPALMPPCQTTESSLLQVGIRGWPPGYSGMSAPVGNTRGMTGSSGNQRFLIAVVEILTRTT